jgi:hypothetical protein
MLIENKLWVEPVRCTLATNLVATKTDSPTSFVLIFNIVNNTIK